MAESFSFLACLSKKTKSIWEATNTPQIWTTSSNFNVHFPVAHAIWESIPFRIVTFLISLEQCRMDEPRIKAEKSAVVV